MAGSRSMTIRCRMSRKHTQKRCLKSCARTAKKLKTSPSKPSRMLTACTAKANPKKIATLESAHALGPAQELDGARSQFKSAQTLKDDEGLVISPCCCSRCSSTSSRNTRGTHVLVSMRDTKNCARGGLSPANRRYGAYLMSVRLLGDFAARVLQETNYQSDHRNSRGGELVDDRLRSGCRGYATRMTRWGERARRAHHPRSDSRLHARAGRGGRLVGSVHVALRADGARRPLEPAPSAVGLPARVRRFTSSRFATHSCYKDFAELKKGLKADEEGQPEDGDGLEASAADGADASSPGDDGAAWFDDVDAEAGGGGGTR